MAIKIKAQERNISFQKGVEKYAYGNCSVNPVIVL